MINFFKVSLSLTTHNPFKLWQIKTMMGFFCSARVNFLFFALYSIFDFILHYITPEKTRYSIKYIKTYNDK